MLKSGEKCNHPLIYGGEIDHVLAALFLSDHPRLDLIRHCTDLTFGAHECCSRPREESRPAKVPAEEALGPLVWFEIAQIRAFVALPHASGRGRRPSRASIRTATSARMRPSLEGGGRRLRWNNDPSYGFSLMCRFKRCRAFT